MRALLITLTLLTCSAESCQHDSLEGSNKVHKAPEIDPGSALAALTLLIGGLLVIRGGKNK